MASAVVVIQSGSQTCTVTTEHTVTSTVAGPGMFMFKVDANACVNGDVFELRAKVKTRAADTQRNADYLTFANAQTDFPTGYKLYIALALNENLDCSIKLTAGTSRAIPWNLLQLDS